MKKSKLLAMLLAASLTLAALTGCGGGATTAAGSADAAANTGAAAGKTDLVVAASEDIASLDPVGSSALQSQLVYRLLYTRLFATDKDMQTYPELAESWEQPSDTEYVFNIYPGAKFSDGSEITAQYVAASLKRAHESSSFSNLWGTVESIEATGTHQVTITTTGPSPALYQTLAHPASAILPKAYLEQENAFADWKGLVFSGRYVISDREEGVSTTLTAREDYFDPENAAQNTSLKFLVVTDDSTRTIVVSTGEADVSTKFGTADYETVQNEKGVKLYETAGTTIQYLGFDTTKAPFDDVRVRQAVAYAIDRDGILSIAANGLGTAAYTVIPPSTLGYEDENPAGYSYNVETAKALLAEAGYANGFETTIVTFSDTAETIATAAQAYLSVIGINAKVERYDTSVRMDMFANHQCPMFAAQWGALADAELVLPRLFTEGQVYNWSYFQNDQVDALLQQARESTDNTERSSLYAQAVEIIDTESPWVPVYVPTTYVLANAGLQGVALDGEGIIDIFALHY